MEGKTQTCLVHGRYGNQGRVHLVMAHEGELPSHTASAYHACVTRCRLSSNAHAASAQACETGATVARRTSRMMAKSERMPAKKDKQARRLARKRKAQRRTPPSGQQVLLKRVRASQHFQNAQVIVNPAGTEKMSEVILRFAEPLKDEYGMVPKAMLELAIIMWNASFMPKDMQRKAMEDILNVIPRENREARREMLRMVTMLLERKRQYFAQNKRLIMDYHITESAHSIYLDVVSTIPEGYNPE